MTFFQANLLHFQISLNFALRRLANRHSAGDSGESGRRKERNSYAIFQIF